MTGHLLNILGYVAGMVLMDYLKPRNKRLYNVLGVTAVVVVLVSLVFKYGN